ncbi:DUF3306 domain-containing protein [Caenispirillum bisanense]|uniref:DUF3306 domain-containing protein n=1 Tax=Caenispirillum bisanense TaxID=414052 RepID=A0A286G5Y2_9PROT|nr:DUF3306 domain-containing protein [Caenispirillum bisanense]SOD90905.1 Protein of unknown function [Caenispirillum bisanense]
MSRPGRDDEDGGGGFLSRWSRLKQEAREREQEPATEPDPAPEPPAEAEPDAADDTAPATDVVEGEATEPLDLPDIDSLTRDSDYSVFMRAGVPADLRRQALRKLWRSDPVLANLDGLNDYDENYAAPSIVGAAVRTAYDVFKGYAPRDVEAGEATAEAADSLEAAAQQSDTAAQYPQPPTEQPEEAAKAAASAAAAEPENKTDESGPLSGENDERA